MNVYIVLEGSGIPASSNRTEMIYSVFSTKEAGEEYLKSLCSHAYSCGWDNLNQKDRKAYDKQGNIYFQIEKRKLNSCQKVKL